MEQSQPSPEKPIRLPEKPRAESRPDETIVISQATIYYFAIAVLFFIAGFAVAWIVLTTTTNNVFNSMKNELASAAGSAAREAVSSAIANLPQDSGAAAAPVQPTPIPRQNVSVGSGAAWGPADAKVTIVEFSDFQCPYCERFFMSTYPLIKEKYGSKVKFVFRHFPIAQIHPWATQAALAAECANEQGKFWEYHDKLFSTLQEWNQGLSKDAIVRYAQQVNVPDAQKFTVCFDDKKYASKIQSDLNEGVGYGVQGTPTFFINGNVLVGAQPFAAFDAAISQELAATGG
ncbi:MAG: DsbA family protein [Anaerolineae bacterium]|nr:DsbA family protein [Anaerolineae bacterium]